MPTYSFKCFKCEHEFTARKKIAERRVPTTESCPDCGAEGTVESVIACSHTVSGVEITDKRPDGWKEVLGRAHKYAGRNSKMDF